MADWTSYSIWGFAVALINWEHLASRSNIYEHFKLYGIQIELSRTDVVFNITMNQDDSKVRK